MKIINSKNIKIITFKKYFKLDNGNYIKNFKIIIEYKFKKINKSILICTALSSSHHVLGIYKKNFKNIGWWNCLMGNKKIMNNKFNILCISNLGSCFGSTNQNDKNPICNKNYKFNFPKLKIKDWIKIQKLTLKKLNIEKIFIIFGGSFGGLQVLLWSIIYPKFIKFFICISTTLKLTKENIIINKINMISIINNYNFYKNIYYKYKINFLKGLKLARVISNISYLSKNEIKKISNYNNINSKSNKFIKFFNIDLYILIIKMSNNFNLKNFFNFIKNNKNYLIIGFINDLRFKKFQSVIIIKLLLKIKKFINFQIITNFKKGHNSFLLNYKNYLNLIKIYINNYISEW